MPFADIYRRQVALLIRLLPLVAEEKCFALKGGTAINLFVRDMPRLSVDIDLTYVPVQSYEASLAAIDTAMGRIGDRIKARIPGSTIAEGAKGARTHLLVRAEGVTNEIEVTPVMRGCVHEPEQKTVTEAVEDAFGFAEMPVLSFADLYAGKFVAALTGSIHGTSSIRASCLPTRASTIRCAALSLCTSEAIRGPCMRCWPQGART